MNDDIVIDGGEILEQESSYKDESVQEDIVQENNEPEQNPAPAQKKKTRPERNYCKDKKVMWAAALPGIGQLIYGQIVKGLLFLLLDAAAILYFVFAGAKHFIGFFTLGIIEGDPWSGVLGDNSVIMLIMGILAWIVIIFLVLYYVFTYKDLKKTYVGVCNGKKPAKFRSEARSLINEKFYVTALAIPVIGVCVFSILPIIFMILMAFTNYGNKSVYPRLSMWVGFKNFLKLVTLSEFGPTFGKILVWNVLWACMSTFVNYFGGLALALLLNKKCVKGKAIWRAFPVLAYAVPGFITLIGFQFMFSNGGPINNMIVNGGGDAINFLGKPSTWSSRFIGLGVNAWISIPTSMLLATGILSNMNTDLYEAARIDGATRWKQFIKLTLPFVIFATTPVLITQFIGNFNNFGIFYFLRSGVESDGYFLASDTDLLINWLYKLTINNTYYSMGAAISLVIFIFTSVVSLSVYVRSAAFKKEDTFR